MTVTKGNGAARASPAPTPSVEGRQKGRLMLRWRVQALTAILVTALGIANCGGGTPTLADYAEQVEPAVAQMRIRIIATDDAIAQPVSSPAEMQAHWRERVAAREEFLAVFEAIEPADEATAIHGAAEDVVRRLTAAEAAVAAQIGEYTELSQLRGLPSTAAYRGFIEVNEESTNICLAAQGMFDDTQQREIFADMPWIPGELNEVVQVVFGCVPGEP